MPVVERDRDYDRDYEEDERPRKARKPNRNARTDHEAGEEASPDAFSHYLHLADGNTVRFQVGNEHASAMPATFGGVAVIGNTPAIAAGTVAEDDEDE